MKKIPQKRKIKSLTQARLETQVFQEEYESGLLLVDQIQKNRVRILRELDRENKLQLKLLDKIEYLKKEFKFLTMSIDTNSKVLGEIKKNNENLNEEVNYYAKELTKIKRKPQSQIIKNNETELVNFFRQKESSNPEDSIVLTILKAFIQTTNENEFDHLNWACKMSANEKAIGARIRFSNLSFSSVDLKEIFSPLVESIKSEYKKYNLVLQTSTKKENNIVMVMDIVVQLTYRHKINELNIS